MDFIQFASWLAGAVVVVGLIQWAKGLVPKIPGWGWAMLMALASIGVGFSMKGKAPVYDGLGIWAIAQLGWDAILKGVIARIGKSSGGEAPKEAKPVGYDTATVPKEP